MRTIASIWKVQANNLATTAGCLEGRYTQESRLAAAICNAMQSYIDVDISDEHSKNAKEEFNEYQSSANNVNENRIEQFFKTGDFSKKKLE